MITIIFEDCNTFSQDIYKQKTDDLQIHMMECTCGKKGCLIRYGHYRRYVKFGSELLAIDIQRVWCKECRACNALIPSVLVPYSQIPLADQQEILECMDGGRSPEPVMEKNNLIDESSVKHIIRQFRRHWEQKIRSIGLWLSDSLSVPCLVNYSMQFMQIRRTRNKLFTQTNSP